MRFLKMMMVFLLLFTAAGCGKNGVQEEMREENNLWLKEGEPDVESVLQEFSRYDLDRIKAVIRGGGFF